LLVHQGFDLKALSDLHLEQPSFSHQIGIQQAGIGEHLLIDFDDLTCDWSVDIRCRINRLYDSGRFAGLDRGAYCSYSRRQQDKGHEEHAAEGGPDPDFHSRVHAVFTTAERRGGCCISLRGHRLCLITRASSPGEHGNMSFGARGIPITHRNTKV
jgi:hypothetical protein